MHFSWRKYRFALAINTYSAKTILFVYFVIFCGCPCGDTGSTVLAVFCKRWRLHSTGLVMCVKTRDSSYAVIRYGSGGKQTVQTTSNMCIFIGMRRTLCMCFLCKLEFSNVNVRLCLLHLFLEAVTSCRTILTYIMQLEEKFLSLW